VYLLNPTGCALVGYGIGCYGSLTGGHIINRSKCGGNKEAIAILKTCPPEIMAIQCYQHNVSRFADTSEAVKIQLLQKIWEYDYIHMQEWFDIFLSSWDEHPIELELARLLSR